MWQTFVDHLWCLVGALAGGGLVGSGVRGIGVQRREREQAQFFQGKVDAAVRESDERGLRVKTVEARLSALEPLEGQLRERERALAELQAEATRLRTLPPTIVEKIVHVDRPVTVEKIVEKVVEVEKPVTVEKVVEKLVTVVDETQVTQLRGRVGELEQSLAKANREFTILRDAPPKVVEKIVEKVVEVEKPVTVEKLVEKIVEKPVTVEKVVEKIVTVVDEMQVRSLRSRVGELEQSLAKTSRDYATLRDAPPKVVEKLVEKVVEVDRPVVVEKVVEKIVQVEKPVTVEKLVEKIVEVDRPVVVEKIIEVDRPVIVEKVVVVDRPVVVEKLIEVERLVHMPAPAAPAAPAATRAPRARRAKPAAAKRPRRPRKRPVDDLELIHGVGPKLARFLNKRGITQFRQVARWTAADIERFEAELPQFKGRIRREGWVRSAAEQHRLKYRRDP